MIVAIRQMKNEARLQDSFKEKLRVLQRGDVVQEILSNISGIDVLFVRCLGLGSVSVSYLAMYQLCLLKLVVDYLNQNLNERNKEESEMVEIKVSLWDPVFSHEDKEFFENHLKYTVEEEFKCDPSSVLYYMPHFPVSIFESVLTEEKPKFILANDLTAYAIKFPETKYFSQYPNCARLTKLITNKAKEESVEKENCTAVKPPDDGFQIFKKKNRKKKNSLVYQPPVIDYGFETAYFKKVKSSIIREGNNTDNPWSSAFTDMSFMVID